MTEMVTSGSMSGEEKRSDGLLGESDHERRRLRQAPPVLYATALLLDSTEPDQWTNKYDPVMTCKPLGLPRHGTPTRIIQTDRDLIFFYPINSDYGGGNNEYRAIPTDGRARNRLAENL